MIEAQYGTIELAVASCCSLVIAQKQVRLARCRQAGGTGTLQDSCMPPVHIAQPWQGSTAGRGASQLFGCPCSMRLKHKVQAAQQQRPGFHGLGCHQMPAGLGALGSMTAAASVTPQIQHAPGQQDALTCPDALPGVCNAEPCDERCRASTLPDSSRIVLMPCSPSGWGAQHQGAVVCTSIMKLCPCADTPKLCTAAGPCMCRACERHPA